MTKKPNDQVVHFFFCTVIYFGISFLTSIVRSETDFPQLPSQPVQTLTISNNRPITDLVFSQDCAYLVIATDDQISLWEENSVMNNDIDNPLPSNSMTNLDWSARWSIKDSNQGLITAVATSSDSAAVAYGTYNGQVQILEPQTGKIERTLLALEPTPTGSQIDFEDQLFLGEPTGEWVTALAFCPNQPVLLAIATLNGNIFLWNIITGKLVYTFRGHTDNVTTLDFYQNGEQLVSGSWDGSIRFWSLATGQLEQKLLAGEEKIGSISVADNRLIVSGTGQPILDWDLSKILPTKNQFSNQGGNLAFSPSSAFFFCQTSDVIYVWSMKEKTNQRFGSMRQLELSDLYRSFALKFNRQDDLFYLAIGTTNGQVLVWDMRQVVEPVALE